MTASIVRRGNHFIRLEGEWCLIDGPWFEYLRRLSNGSSMPVRLSYCDKWEPVWSIADEPPHMGDIKEVEWLPKRWYPAHINPWRFGVLPGHHPLRDKWNEWMAGRIRKGYVLMPDGELPPFLNRPMPNEPHTRSWWADAWNWYHQ